MSAGNEKLLAKLKKQAEKKINPTIQKIKKEVEKKKETVEIPVPISKPVLQSLPKTSKHIEQRAQEEETVRSLLNMLITNQEDPKFIKLLSSAKENYVSELKKVMVEEKEEKDDEDDENKFNELWDNLTDEEKRPFILEAIGNQKTAVSGRKVFFSELAKLDFELQNSFIDKYLDQNANYTTFYELWYSDKENQKLIRQTYNKSKLSYDVPNRISEIKKEIHDQAIKYLEDSNVKLTKDQKLLPFKLLEKETRDLSKVLAPYIEHLKISLDNSIGSIAYLLAKKEKMITLTNPEESEKILNGDLVSMTKEKGINTNFPLSIIRLKLLENLKTEKRLKTNMAEEKKRNWKKTGKKSVYDPDLYVDEEGETYYNPNTKEKINLILKISNITGNNPTIYYNYSFRDLEEEFKKLEINKEYHEKIEREYMIDEITKLSNQPRELFEKLSYQEAKSKLDELSSQYVKQEERKIIRRNQLEQVLQTQQCVTEIKNYIWIPEAIKEIKISCPSSENIASIASYIQHQDPPPEDNFYNPNTMFFILQCNAFSDKRTQKGNILT